LVGLRVTGDDGRTYYADRAWPEFAVIGEVDGYGKYRADTWQTFRREKQREDALRAAGWLVVRWTVTEVLRDPGSVVARVRRALLTARRQASRRIPS
jgi:very-short-patch-repair endonuclease